MSTKAKHAFEELVSQLPEFLRQGVAQQPVESDDEKEFQRIAKQVPFFKALQEKKSDEEVDTSLFKFSLLESFEGQFPKVRIFSTLSSMLQYMLKLENQDVSVWPFFGTPLRFTAKDTHGTRYLILPNRKAISIPRYPGDPGRTLDASAVEHLDFQEDGWLGDPALVDSSRYLQGTVDVDPEEDDEDDEE